MGTLRVKDCAGDTGKEKWFAYEYERPCITADIVAIHIPFDNMYADPEALVIRRKDAPYKNFLAFPGGFMNQNETLMECAIREFREETNIETNQMLFVGMQDEPLRDTRARVVSAIFFLPLYNKPKPQAADDAASCEYFPIPALKGEKMAFDHHQILLKVLNFMKVHDFI